MDAARAFVLKWDKEFWPDSDHQLNITRANTASTIHASAQLQCNCAIEVPVSPPRGTATLSFLEYTDANQAILALLAYDISASADIHNTVPEGYDVVSFQDPRNPRWKYSGFQPGRNQRGGVGGVAGRHAGRSRAKGGEPNRKNARRSMFHVFCGGLGAHADDALLGYICLRGRCRPHSIQLSRDRNKQAGHHQLMEFVGGLEHIICAQAMLPYEGSLTQHYSRSRSQVPTFLMDEQPLDDVVNAVTQINQLSSDLRCIGSSGKSGYATRIRAVANLSAQMRIHSGIYGKLKRKINGILENARRTGLYVECVKPTRSGGRFDEQYTIVLSNSRSQWQHRLHDSDDPRVHRLISASITIEDEVANEIRSQGQCIKHVFAELEALLVYTAPKFDPHSHLLFSKPGRDIMSRIAAGIEGAFVYWDTTTRVVRLFGESAQQIELERRLRGELEGLRSKHFKLDINPRMFRRAIQEKRQLLALRGVHEVFVRHEDGGGKGALVEFVCEENARQPIRNHLERKKILCEEADVDVCGGGAEEQLCGICYDDLDRDQQECVCLLRCSHWFHEECISPMLNTEDRDILKEPLCCMTCRHVDKKEGEAAYIAVSDVQDLCSAGSLARWRDIAKETALADNSAIEYCPNRCNTLLRIGRPKNWNSEENADWGSFFDCPSCQIRMCVRCSHPDNCGETVEVDPRGDVRRARHSTFGQKTSRAREFNSCKEFQDWKRRSEMSQDRMQQIRTKIVDEALNMVCPFPSCENICYDKEVNSCDAAHCDACDGYFCWFCWTAHIDNCAAHNCAASHNGVTFWNAGDQVERSHRNIRLRQLKRAFDRELPEREMADAREHKTNLIDLMEADLRGVGISVLLATQFVFT